MQNDATGSEYLRGEDLQKDGKWCEFTLTISEAHAPDTLNGADGKPIDKPVLMFANAKKGFVVGKTNQRLLKCVLGAKPKNWEGKKITVYPATGNWFGVPDAIAVRVRVPKGCGRPFIKPANLGKDITGKSLPNAEPATHGTDVREHPAETELTDENEQLF